jgi:hypothetical protein
MLLSAHAKCGVALFVFNQCDSNHIVISKSEKNDIGKSAHKTAPNVFTDDHVAEGPGGDVQNLTIKLIDERLPKMEGTGLVKSRISFSSS